MVTIIAHRILKYLCLITYYPGFIELGALDRGLRPVVCTLFVSKTNNDDGDETSKPVSYKFNPN